MSVGGALGAFFLKDLNWVLFTGLEPIELVQPWTRTHLVESNGDQSLACQKVKTFHVFVFDWEKRQGRL